MTATNYQDYGLNPDKDFASGLSIHRKMLNLIKYYKVGLRPNLDPLSPPVFTEDESIYICNLTRNTVKGRFHLDIYRTAAGIGRYQYFQRTIAERFEPLVRRFLREKMCDLEDCEGMYLSCIGLHVLPINYALNRFLISLRDKYDLHRGTIASLGFSVRSEWLYNQHQKEIIESIPCCICGKTHHNKIRLCYYRSAANKIMVYKYGFEPNSRVLPYCKDCGDVYTRKKAKEDYKADKALKEAKEIGKILHLIKQEIKANGKQN